MTTLNEWGLAAATPPAWGPFDAVDGATLSVDPAPAGTVVIIRLPPDTFHAQAAAVGGVSSQATCLTTGGSCPGGSQIALTLDGTTGVVAVTWDNNTTVGFQIATESCAVNIAGAPAKPTGPAPTTPTTTPSSTGTIIGVIAAVAAVGGAVYFFTR